MPTQDVPGYYVWEVPGQPVAVHVELGTIDRLAAEVMRGFGAIPKRGAEVGGVLLGSVEPGSASPWSPAIVRVDDFVVVPCEYRLGPSYQLTETDFAEFENVCARQRPVGYFRSHTRDGLALAPEDLDLLDDLFGAPAAIALLVKPFATKVSIAGFFFRDNGAFQESTPLEFPFRRRDLSGEPAPQRRTLMERRARSAGRSMSAAPVGMLENPAGGATNIGTNVGTNIGTNLGANLGTNLGTNYATNIDAEAEPFAIPAPPAARPAWVWALLALALLALGGLLGYWVAVSGIFRGGAAVAQDFSLSLTVSKSGDNLAVKWDGQAAAIRTAQKAVLEIEDGGSSKPVDLDAAQLQNGNLIYRSRSSTVRFKLTVYPRARVSVTETVEWRE